MKIILKSPYPYLIKTDSQECEVNENDSILIEDENWVSIYPQTNLQIPFKINFNNLKENDFYSLSKHQDDLIVIFNMPNRLKIGQKERLNFSNKSCDILVDDQSICFETANKKIEYLCDHKLRKPKIFKLKDFACVQTEGHLYAYSVKNNRLSHFSGELELNGDVLKVTKNLNDSDNRIRTSSYKFEDEIVTQSENFIKNSSISSKDLVPYKLLESVKAKDYPHALEYLSENLKVHVNKEKLSEFFGNFTAFLPITTTEFITMSPNANNFVTFSLADNKIEDINVDVL